MRDILNMHIIKDRLNVEKIKQKNQNLVILKFFSSNTLVVMCICVYV